MHQQNTFTIRGVTFVLAPQTAQILRHLKRVGDISGVEASAMYKARSLTKRISEINDALYFNGFMTPEYSVEGQWNRDNTGQRYKRYVLPVEMRNEMSFA